jgi:hypothetical protein
VRVLWGSPRALCEQPGFIEPIANGAEYAQALVLMGELIEDYEANHLLVDILSHSIEAWEDSSDEFARFNVAPRIPATARGSPHKAQSTSSPQASHATSHLAPR